MNFLDKYGIKIKDENLLLTALTHSSFSNENNCENYERLEFLGDAVLQLIVSDYLYQNENVPEGKMSKERSRFVCEEALAYYVKEIGYEKYIRLGNGLHEANDTIIADTFESVLAVIYLECGFNTCKDYLEKTVFPHIKNEDIFFIDYKTKLQELVQTDKKSLEYELVDSFGEAHDMHFKYAVKVDGIILGVGEGRTKKEAEQMAAREALRK